MKWIPMSERLPENGHYYLWCSDMGSVQSDYYWDGFEKEQKYGYNIVAWMPLPRPYTADRKTEPTGYNLSPVAKDINVRSKDEPKLSEIPTSKCHYEPKADGILFKGNLKEGDYKLIKTSNGWVLEGNDIAYYGEPQTGRSSE